MTIESSSGAAKAQVAASGEAELEAQKMAANNSLVYYPDAENYNI
jgi:hypothetical protein